MALVKDVAAAVLDVLDVLEGRVAQIDPHTAAAHRANLGAGTNPEDAGDSDSGGGEPGPGDGA